LLLITSCDVNYTPQSPATAASQKSLTLPYFTLWSHVITTIPNSLAYPRLIFLDVYATFSNTSKQQFEPLEGQI